MPRDCRAGLGRLAQLGVRPWRLGSAPKSKGTRSGLRAPGTRGASWGSRWAQYAPARTAQLEKPSKPLASPSSLQLETPRAPLVERPGPLQRTNPWPGWAHCQPGAPAKTGAARGNSVSGSSPPRPGTSKEAEEPGPPGSAPPRSAPRGAWVGRRDVSQASWVGPWPGY